MLRIQLCPEAELEDHYWWAPDVIALVAALTIAWFGAGMVLDSIREETEQLTITSTEWGKQYAEVKPAVEKFQNLDEEILLLKRKVDALKRITVSRVDKVLPVVVMEQLQTLRPEGLWYHSLEYREDKTVRISGASRESLLISEFLLGLRETMNPETITTDIRTQVGFIKIKVKEVQDERADKGFDDLKDVLSFEASATVIEKRKPDVTPASVAVPTGRSTRGAWF